MDDRNQPPYPRRSRSGEQQEQSQTSITREQPTPFVPNELEPATDRRQYAASENSVPTFAFASEPVVQNGQQPAPADQQQVAATPPPQKKSKKKLVISILMAGIVALLVGGAVAAYNLWYQNPDKVLADSLTNLMKATSVAGNGKLVYASNDGDVTITVDHITGQREGRATVAMDFALKDPEVSVALSGEGVYTEERDLYVKVNDLQDAYESLLEDIVELAAGQAEPGQTIPEEQMQQYKDMVDGIVGPVVEKIDSRWIKISSDDLEGAIEGWNDETGECAEAAFADLQKDEAKQREIVDAYKKNKFIVVQEQLGSRNGSLGYLLDIDEAAAEAFGEAAKQTATGRQLEECGDEVFSELEDNSAQSDNTITEDTRFELWVDRWSHEVTRVYAEARNEDNVKMTFDYSPRFNENVTVDAPSDVITIKELQAEVEQAMGAAMEELYGEASYNENLYDDPGFQDPTVGPVAPQLRS